jgi:peptidoglycan/xylan/chitin deacetylase (PgdA/CDA1 family)
MSPLVRRLSTGKEAKLCILMYHSISDTVEHQVHPYYRLATSPYRFREQMRLLQDSGLKVVSLETALQILESRRPLEFSLAAITFDDGYQDFITTAWPILQEFGYPSTVFLPTGSIDRARRSFKGRTCLTWDEVKRLHREGVTFGSHTVSHPVLAALPWFEVARELRDSRRAIESILEQPIDLFAYPYAFPGEDVRLVAKLRAELVAVGYRSMVTTMVGREAKDADLHSLRRLPVNDADDPALFLAKLRGDYDWVGAIQTRYRSTRHALREMSAATRHAHSAR